MTIPTPAATYHFYELDVKSLDQDWLEQHERRREWVDYAEAIKRLEWKTELAEGLKCSSLAPRSGKTELAEGLKSSSLAPRAELLANTKSFFSGLRT